MSSLFMRWINYLPASGRLCIGAQCVYQNIYCSKIIKKKRNQCIVQKNLHIYTDPYFTSFHAIPRGWVKFTEQVGIIYRTGGYNLQDRWVKFFRRKMKKWMFLQSILGIRFIFSIFVAWVSLKNHWKVIFVFFNYCNLLNIASIYNKMTFWGFQKGVLILKLWNKWQKMRSVP